MKRHYTHDEVKRLLIMDNKHDELYVNTDMHPDDLEEEGYSHFRQFQKHAGKSNYHKREHSKLRNEFKRIKESPYFDEKKDRGKLSRISTKMNYHKHMSDVETNAAKLHSEAFPHYMVPARHLRWHNGQTHDRYGIKIDFEGHPREGDEKYNHTSDEDREDMSRKAWQATGAIEDHEEKVRSRLGIK